MNYKDDQGNDEICVKIKTLDNNTFDIRIKCAQTVSDLKYLIESVIVNQLNSFQPYNPIDNVYYSREDN